ncbi:MAG: hypothetical protein VX740_10505 [Pseudomonadota bacterium]|jgi:hypothetical protein|nr:hypothetical protein [Alphaproteobacteria bacterium]MEC7576735.1 hypothetical protein [Pseudomonadota bacterium]MEC7702185.1 hypothetical protein [Pseudomonadota bacterium]MED5423857.1 hypothetical protein [Pseudomonadota bacterium]
MKLFKSKADKIWDKYKSGFADIRKSAKPTFVDFYIDMYLNKNFLIGTDRPEHEEFIKTYGEEYISVLQSLVADDVFKAYDAALLINMDIKPYACVDAPLGKAIKGMYYGLGEPVDIYKSCAHIVCDRVAAGLDAEASTYDLVTLALSGTPDDVGVKLTELLSIIYDGEDSPKVKLYDTDISNIGDALMRIEPVDATQNINKLHRLVQKAFPQYVAGFNASLTSKLDGLSGLFNAHASGDDKAKASLVNIAKALTEEDGFYAQLTLKNINVSDVKTVKLKDGGVMMGELVSVFDKAGQRQDVVLCRTLTKEKDKFVENVHDPLVGADVISMLNELHGENGAKLGTKLVADLPKRALIM